MSILHNATTNPHHIPASDDCDPTGAAAVYGVIFALMGFVALIWATHQFGPMLFDMSADLFRDAGTLTSCTDRSLHGAECMAYAQTLN